MPAITRPIECARSPPSQSEGIPEVSGSEAEVSRIRARQDAVAQQHHRQRHSASSPPDLKPKNRNHRHPASSQQPCCLRCRPWTQSSSTRPRRLQLGHCNGNAWAPAHGTLSANSRPTGGITDFASDTADDHNGGSHHVRARRTASRARASSRIAKLKEVWTARFRGSAPKAPTRPRQRGGYGTG
jgi:hypothetical protein